MVSLTLLVRNIERTQELVTAMTVVHPRDGYTCQNKKDNRESGAELKPPQFEFLLSWVNYLP